MRFVRSTKITALTVALVTLLAVALAACGKGPDERACELRVKDFGSIFALQRDPKVLVDLREISTDIEEIAQDGSPDIAAAATNLKIAIAAATEVADKRSFEAFSDLGGVCDNHGYTYDYFYPNRRP